MAGKKNTHPNGQSCDPGNGPGKLPYRKVLFTKKPDPADPSCIYIPGFESEQSLGLITEPIGSRGKRAIDRFDWVAFLNGPEKQQRV